MREPVVHVVWMLAAVAWASVVPNVTVAERIQVGPHTQLRVIDFEFANGNTLGDGTLRKVLAQQTVGKHTTLRGWFDWLPFVEPVVPQPFVPLELQKDVARLRDFYRRSGFSATDVRYRVAVEPKDDLADVTFLIAEGRPFVLERITVTDSIGAAPEAWLPVDQRKDWRQLLTDQKDHIGKRAGDKEQQAIEAQVLAWFRDHGHPYARVSSQSVRDESDFTADLQAKVVPGPRARIEEIRVEGNVPGGSQIVRTTVPIAVGDWYSAQRLADGQRALLGREIIRSASADLPPQPQDSTLEVVVRVQKAKTHLLTGELGYLSDGGLTARGEWRHRSFTGGARTLSVSLIAQTGVWALDEIPERLLRLSPALTLPGVLHPRASLVFATYGEYRDDIDDLSWGYGFTPSLVYFDNSWVRTASLGYTISVKEVIEYRAGSDDLDFFGQVEAATDVDKHTTLSSFTLAATLGRQDDTMKPRRLLLFRPSVQATVPSAWNTSEFVRLDLSTSLGRPLRRGMSVWGRFAVGRMFPYGKTFESGDGEGNAEGYFELRDDLFTAGGGGDVRGWDSRLLGPKFPDLESGPDSTLLAESYLPVGGLARMSASLELRLPFPLLASPWGMHVFTDGGRVWSPDDRFLGAEDPFDQTRWFFASGIGLDRDSPVGPIRLSFAYVLNPSPLDVLKPQEFVNELQANGLTNVHTHWNRRLHVHLALGAAF